MATLVASQGRGQGKGGAHEVPAGGAGLPVALGLAARVRAHQDLLHEPQPRELAVQQVRQQLGQPALGHGEGQLRVGQRVADVVAPFGAVDDGVALGDAALRVVPRGLAPGAAVGADGDAALRHAAHGSWAAEHAVDDGAQPRREAGGQVRPQHGPALGGQLAAV